MKSNCRNWQDCLQLPFLLGTKGIPNILDKTPFSWSLRHQMKTHHQALQTRNKRKTSNLTRTCCSSLSVSSGQQLLKCYALGPKEFSYRMFSSYSESSHLATSNLSSHRNEEMNKLYKQKPELMPLLLLVTSPACSRLVQAHLGVLNL